MDVVLIVAMSRNRVIGREGQLPWRIREDLQRFKRLTMGHPIIMGRKTWDSIGRPLPGRESVVVTRQPLRIEGATVVHGLEEALAHAGASGAKAAFVVGGGEIYRQALPHADRIELTLVHADVEGDTTFPGIDETEWREVARENREQDDGLRYDFVTFVRRSTA